MYARDVRVKIFKERVQTVHDWVFTTVPGLGLFAAFAIGSAFLFKSTAYTIMIVGTAMFLLGTAVGRSK